jgi:hypothetical protein
MLLPAVRMPALATARTVILTVARACPPFGRALLSPRPEWPPWRRRELARRGKCFAAILPPARGTSGRTSRHPKDYSRARKLAREYLSRASGSHPAGREAFPASIGRSLRGPRKLGPLRAGLGDQILAVALVGPPARICAQACDPLAGLALPACGPAGSSRSQNIYSKLYFGGTSLRPGPAWGRAGANGSRQTKVHFVGGRLASRASLDARGMASGPGMAQMPSRSTVARPPPPGMAASCRPS